MSENITVELADDVAEALFKASKDRDLRVARLAAKENLEFLANLRPKVKGVKGFWPAALLGDEMVKLAASSAGDKEALKYLSDVELVQDHKDPRAFEIIFHFNENPYFTNKTLSKKYALPEGAAAAPADGSITDEMRAFEMDDLIPTSMTIDWKPDHDLTKKHPRPALDEGEFEGDPGSFFHLFTEVEDPFSLGPHIAMEILADPLHFFENDEDFDDEDELDDDEGSIDLEDDDEDKPAKKRQRAD